MERNPYAATYNVWMRPPRSSTATRLRWALVIALVLHVGLLLRYAPTLFAKVESVLQAPSSAPAKEEIVEISAPEPPPKGRGMVLSPRLGDAGPPGRLPPDLPPDFFANSVPRGSFQLADNLDFARLSGVQIVANIIPAATRLPKITALSDQARTPRLQPLPPVSSPAPPVNAAEPELADTPISDQQIAQALTQGSLPPAPSAFVLAAPPAPELNVDDAIAAAASAAAQSARSANSSSNKPAPDYRALLLQAPTANQPAPASARADAGLREEGIRTFALDAPPAEDARRAAPDDGKALTAARQQFFAQLTAQLKATNVRLLAEAIKAGPRTMVRMRFLVDRDGRVLEISPAEPVLRELADRAAAVILAAPLPPVPPAMTQVPLELSFPVEIYR